MSARAGEPLLVLIDVGNTNTVLGVYAGDELRESFRLSTDPERTEDEYGALLLPLFARAGLEPADAEAVVVSSVVPPLNGAFERLSRRFFGKAPLFVEPGIKTGMPIRYDNPAEVGADRIVNALAARELFGAPVVVVDFGTATTFDVVNAAGEYTGGIICPGIGIARPQAVIGRQTVPAMQSGVYWGYVALVEGLVARIKAEFGGPMKVVATGGLASLFAEGTMVIEQIEPDLTLDGLRMLAERNPAPTLRPEKTRLIEQD